MLYQLIRTFIAWPITRLWWPKVRGRKNIPSTGGALLAGNHISFSDSIFVPAELSRHITFLAKQEYFTKPGLNGVLQRWFFNGVGQVPVDRSGGRSAEAAIRTGVDVLKRGALLGIYPEGTRSPDGRLYKGRTGAARMAIEAQVPIVPIAVVNTFWIQPAGRLLPRLGRRVGINIGTPIATTPWVGRHTDPAAMRELTEMVMQELLRLGGQEYVDIYATKAKDLIKAGIDPAQWARENRTDTAD